MNIFEMLREKDHRLDLKDTHSSLLHRVASEFQPQPDISSFELAQIFKIFAMMSVEMDIEEVRRLANEHNVIRHFKQM